MRVGVFKGGSVTLFPSKINNLREKEREREREREREGAKYIVFKFLF